MLYNEACGERLSRLGFGCMRLPQTADKAIDENELQRMADCAIERGRRLDVRRARARRRAEKEAQP